MMDNTFFNYDYNEDKLTKIVCEGKVIDLTYSQQHDIIFVLEEELNKNKMLSAYDGTTSE